MRWCRHQAVALVSSLKPTYSVIRTRTIDRSTMTSERERELAWQGPGAACPLRADALGAARPRVTLDNQVACSSLTDRHACCAAIDGGTSAARAGSACVPAATIFQNGHRCETARCVALVRVRARARARVGRTSPSPSP